MSLCPGTVDDLLHLLRLGVTTPDRSDFMRGALSGLVIAAAVAEHGVDKEAAAIEVQVLFEQGKRLARQRWTEEEA